MKLKICSELSSRYSRINAINANYITHVLIGGLARIRMGICFTLFVLGNFPSVSFADENVTAIHHIKSATDLSHSNALGQALDAPELQWLTGGDAHWFTQTNETLDDIDAAQSGVIGNNQQSWIETTVTTGRVSAILNFWWKVSSEENYDFLRFYVNDELVREISGDTSWQRVQYCLHRGASYALRWSYEKDDTETNGIDAGWLEQVTTIIQEKKLFANHLGVLKHNDYGVSVALFGDTALVGRRWGNSNENDAGAAYIFERNRSGKWAETAKLIPQDGELNDQFGDSVALHGDTALVGSRLDDDNGNNSGAVYIFERDSSGKWAETAKLLPHDGQSGDRFGTSIAFHGDTALVSADGDDDNGNGSGAAYIFKRNSAKNWTQTAKLIPGDGEENDLFGRAVALDRDTALIGSYADDESGYDSGSAYVFERDGAGGWKETAKLLPRDRQAFDHFGYAVALERDTALVGAYQDDESGYDSGSAYIFERNGENNWKEIVKLAPQDGSIGDKFGVSVALDGDTALVGAYQDDDNGTYSGSVYIFERVGEDNLEGKK